MSLRREKAARLKISILEQTLRLVGRKSFDDLHVEDICAKVKISKVTFFNYFPQKEDVLLYYFRIWCLHRAVELRDKPREGVAGMYYLFEKLSEDCENYPGVILSLIGYLADLKRPPKPFPVKLEEKQLLYPDRTDMAHMEILSVDQLFEKFALESIFRKEITRTSSTRELTNLLASVFYGVVVSTHVHQQVQLRFYFRRTLDMLLKGLA
jgi:AcrR family transcriptional regulator